MDGEQVVAETVIIATGANTQASQKGSRRRSARDEGRDLLRDACDGALPVFRNQPLVVVGGGDFRVRRSALSDSALWL